MSRLAGIVPNTWCRPVARPVLSLRVLVHRSRRFDPAGCPRRAKLRVLGRCIAAIPGLASFRNQ